MAGFPGFNVIEGFQHSHDYPIASTNTAIGAGDIVQMRDDGFVWRSAAGSGGGQGTTGMIIGIAVHAVAANTGGVLKVYDDPNLVFRGTSDDASIDLQTDFGLSYDLVDAAPVNGRSQQLIDGSTGTTSALQPIKILRLSNIITQAGNVLGAGVTLDCQFNQHFLKGGSAGI